MEKATNILSGPPFNPKMTDSNVGEYIYKKILKYGSEIAMINADTGEEITYSKIANDTKKLAVYLNKLNLTINDRIGICSENNFEFVTAALSSLILGITICPVNPLYNKREFQHILTISKPKYIFVSSFVLPKLYNIINDFSWSPKLILLNKNNLQLKIPNIYDIIENITDIESNNLKIPKVILNDHVAAIFCSSGTTGMPKGVMLTDKNFLFYFKRGINFCNSIKLLNNKITITGLLPFFHGYGFAMLFSVTLQLGVRMIVFNRFDENTFLSKIEKYKINILTLVPTLLVIFLKSQTMNKYDLSSVRKILTGGSKLSLETEKEIMKRFNIDYIQSAYGLTETTVVIIFNHQEFYKIGSVGKLEPGTLAKVVSIDDKNSKNGLGPNCEGELCFKGPFIMKGYYDDINATNNVIDKDGWFHSGDVGYYDENGYFYIVDRIKEIIKYKGYQVAPAEIESILLSHPLIKDAAVVGIFDEEAGELPFALVVKVSGSKLTEEDVKNFVNGSVSSQKRLRGGVKFIKEIPRNSTGKILRRQLQNLIKSKL